LKTLTITGNEVLTSLTATGIAAVGVTAGAAVNVYGNNFTATKSADSENTATTLTATGAANDLGAFTTTSGLEDLKAYLALVVADTKATANVYFDTVESYVGEDGVEDGTDATYSSETTRDTTTASDEQRILVLEADNTVADDAALAAKRAWRLDLSNVTITTTINILNEAGVSIISTDDDTLDSDETFSIGATDTPAEALAKLQAGATATRAAVYGITYTAKRGGANTGSVQLITYSKTTSTTPTAFGERYTTAAARLAAASFTTGGTWASEGAPSGITSATLVKLTVGGNSVTASAGVVGGTTTDTASIAAALVSAWTAKYGASGTASTSAIFDISSDANGLISITATADDSKGYDKTMSVAIAGGGGGNNLDYTIGSTNASGDNNTVDSDIIITLESTEAGTLLNKVDYAGVSSQEVGHSIMVEMTNTYYANSDPTAEQFGRALATEERTDARNAEDTVTGSASTATRFTRVHWL